jgi:enterochelin esterase-like enzyme
MPDALEKFWQEVAAAGTPLIEPDGESVLVTFLWRGQARSTSVAWGCDVPLARIPSTDLWHGSARLPADLRSLYYLCHNGTEDVPTDAGGTGPTHIDPMNHHPFCFPVDPGDPTDRAHWASLLELPAAPAEPWTLPRPGVPRGALLQATLRSRALGGRRRVWVYRPSGVPVAGLPLLVVFDGFLSLKVLRIPTALDNLIAAGRIPPLVAVFVSSPNGERRNRELRPGRPIVDFVTRELVPWARRRWHVCDDPATRVIAGASLGGLAACYVGLRAARQFGAVIAQSGSFWWSPPGREEPEWLTARYAEQPLAPLRFYLDVGTQENISPRGDHLAQLPVTRRMRDTLVERGYPVTYLEYPGAHDYVNWRRTFPEALIALLGGDQPGGPRGSRY